MPSVALVENRSALRLEWSVFKKCIKEHDGNTLVSAYKRSKNVFDMFSLALVAVFPNIGGHRNS